MKSSFIILLFAFLNFYSFAEERVPYNIMPGIYRMLDYPVNIRDQPNLNGSVIGRLQLHDEIEVVDNMGNPQIIGGFLQNWYRIRISNIEGYIWGGFIATTIFIHDIDGNGIMDFFYTRDSFSDGFIEIFPNDFYIYINNQRISNRVLYEIYAESDRWWIPSFLLRENDGNIFLSVASGTFRNHVINSSHFIISSSGIIFAFNG